MALVVDRRLHLPGFGRALRGQEGKSGFAELNESAAIRAGRDENFPSQFRLAAPALPDRLAGVGGPSRLVKIGWRQRPGSPAAGGQREQQGNYARAEYGFWVHRRASSWALGSAPCHQPTARSS